jgi:hypothetical protein
MYGAFGWERSRGFGKDRTEDDAPRRLLIVGELALARRAGVEGVRLWPFCLAFSVPAMLAAIDNIDGRAETAETGLSISCVSYEAEERCALSIDERTVELGSSSTDASNGSRGNLMGDVLRLFDAGDVGDNERSGCRNEDRLSNEGRGLCNRFECRLAGVLVPDPEGSLDLFLL